MQTAQPVTDIAQALVDARRLDNRLTSYPGAIPPSFATAYAIQDAAIELRGNNVAGWKVGRVRADFVAQFGAERLAGPIFADTIVKAADGMPVKMPVLKGFAAIEAELLLRIGGSTNNMLSAADAMSVVDEVRFGFEIASSPFAGINDNGPAVTASDFGNNYGLVLGPVVKNWRERDLLAAPVSLSINGAVVGQGSAADMLDGPFGSVAFIINLMRERGIKVAPGTWISTGAITGVHRITPGQSAVAIFDGREMISANIVATAQ
jgi:2-keto-4-pentenoate hydratase